MRACPIPQSRSTLRVSRALSANSSAPISDGARSAGGGGLGDAAALDVGVAGAVVGVGGGFVHVEHRRDAGVATVEDGAPFVARAGCEDGRQRRLEGWPLGTVPGGRSASSMPHLCSSNGA